MFIGATRTYSSFKFCQQKITVNKFVMTALRRKYVPRSMLHNKQNLEFECQAPVRLAPYTADLFELNKKEETRLAGWAEEGILKDIKNKTQNSNTSVKVTKDKAMPISICKGKSQRHRPTEEPRDYKTGIFWLKKQVEFLEASDEVEQAKQIQKFPKKENFLNLSKALEVQACKLSVNPKFASKVQQIHSRQLSSTVPINYSFLLTTPAFCKVIAEHKGVFRRPSRSASREPRPRKVYSEQNDTLISAIAELESTRPRYLPTSFKKCRPKKRNYSVRTNNQSESHCSALKQINLN